MELSQIYKPIEKELSCVRALIKNNLTADSFTSELCHYILKTEGKMIRPAIILLASKLSDNLAGIESPRLKIWQFAAAIELIHTATLIHDDMLDKSCMRRFHQTINAKWGDDFSILFGDHLFSKAFSVLTEIDSAQLHKLTSEATNRISEGEFVQLNNRYNLALTREEYLFIIERKTASLFSACTKGAAILINLNKKEQDDLFQFGLNFGMAFQIIDDIHDFIGSEFVLGKPYLNDMGGGKITLPVIGLLKQITGEDRQTVARIFDRNRKIAAMEKDVQLFLDLLKENNSISFAIKEADKFLTKANVSLENMKESPAKNGLVNLTGYLFGLMQAQTSFVAGG